MKKYKNIILIIAIFIIAFVAYTMLFGGERDEALLTSESVEEISDVEGNLLPLLMELRKVELEASIFSSPAFRSLQDFSQELVPEPVGRRNPFAPLGVEIGVEMGVENSPIEIVEP
jgi:hypothetical protein